jgi:hypothetical protein
MLSYKNWKTINESLNGVVLGVASPQSLGIISNMPTEEEFLAEMKKKWLKLKLK